ncbi:FG-GAP repeat domain-containing protein [Streptomyces sp. NPDC058619]|uniref:FG-GAP repeat domain-containing protein n=1 Tax=unclassified Streptomyces TaxID=2593676 RepID=UPI00364E4AF6
MPALIRTAMAVLVAQSPWIPFPNEPALSDVDGDGDRDGRRDLVTVGESARPVTRIEGRPPANARIQVFRGIGGPERFSSEPIDVAAGGGALLPVVEDIDSDGDLDLVSPQYFEPKAAYVWLERTAAPSPDHPMGTFARHVIDTTQGRAIALRPVRNLYGDGRTTWVGANHTNTAFPAGLGRTGLAGGRVLRTGGSALRVDADRRLERHHRTGASRPGRARCVRQRGHGRGSRHRPPGVRRR